MNCRTAQRRLATCRPDDQLPLDVAAHLRQCGLCRSAFDDDRAIWSLLSEYTAPPSSATSVEDVLLRRAGRKARVWFPLDLMPTRGLAAALAAVTIIGTVSGLWCGRTLVDLRISSIVPPTVSSAAAVDEAKILTATPPGSLAAAYLEHESEPDR